MARAGDAIGAGDGGSRCCRRPLHPQRSDLRVLKGVQQSIAMIHHPQTSSAIVVPVRASSHGGRRHAPPPPPHISATIRREVEVEEVSPSPPHRRPHLHHPQSRFRPQPSTSAPSAAVAASHRRSHPGHRPRPPLSASIADHPSRSLHADDLPPDSAAQSRHHLCPRRLCRF